MSLLNNNKYLFSMFHVPHTFISLLTWLWMTRNDWGFWTGWEFVIFDACLKFQRNIKTDIISGIKCQEIKHRHTLLLHSVTWFPTSAAIHKMFAIFQLDHCSLCMYTYRVAVLSIQQREWMKCFLFQWFLTSLHNILLSKCLKSRTLKSHFLIILKKLLFLKPTPPPNSVNNDKEKNPHASLISVISYPVQEIIAKKLSNTGTCTCTIFHYMMTIIISHINI